MPSPDTADMLYRGAWLDVRRRDGREFMLRNHCKGVAIIVAVTEAGELLLCEQYRVPVGARVLELPAGLIGDAPGLEGETKLDAAKRELLEETGYEARTLTQLAAGPVSPGISSEMMDVFYTDRLIRRHEGGGDDSEAITVHAVRLEEVPAFIRSCEQNGIMADLKLFMGLYFAQLQHSKTS